MSELLLQACDLALRYLLRTQPREFVRQFFSGELERRLAVIDADTFDPEGKIHAIVALRDAIEWAEGIGIVQAAFDYRYPHVRWEDCRVIAVPTYTRELILPVLGEENQRVVIDEIVPGIWLALVTQGRIVEAQGSPIIILPDPHRDIPTWARDSLEGER